MNSLPEVIDAITEHIGKNPHVEKVILFGSRARGDQRERSDIDLAVVGAEIADSEWTDIWSYVDDAPTLLGIDLVRFEEAPDTLRESILKEGIALYERPPVR
jgi:predicted nucleotidyltransferase